MGRRLQNSVRMPHALHHGPSFVEREGNKQKKIWGRKGKNSRQRARKKSKR